MNVGKTLFAQVMEFVPWKTFGRVIERHKVNADAAALKIVAHSIRHLVAQFVSFQQVAEVQDRCLIRCQRSSQVHFGNATHHRRFIQPA